MGFAGVWVGIQVLKIQPPDPQVSPRYLEIDRITRDIAHFSAEVESSRQRAEASLENHLLTYTNLRNGRMLLGMRLTVNQSFLELSKPHALPLLPSSLLGPPSHTLNANPGLELSEKLLAIQRSANQIGLLQSRFQPLSQDIRRHLLQTISLNWDPESTEIEPLAALNYSFSNLANDRLLRNYYFEVISHYQAWLAETHKLLEALQDLQDLPGFSSDR